MSNKAMRIRFILPFLTLSLFVHGTDSSIERPVLAHFQKSLEEFKVDKFFC